MRACQAAQLVAVERVVERQHRARSCRTGANVADGGAPTSCERRVAGASSGYCASASALELAHQLVELGVGDLGLVVAVVALAVVADLAPRARRRARRPRTECRLRLRGPSPAIYRPGVTADGRATSWWWSAAVVVVRGGRRRRRRRRASAAPWSAAPSSAAPSSAAPSWWSAASSTWSRSTWSSCVDVVVVVGGSSSSPSSSAQRRDHADRARPRGRSARR